MGQTAAFTAADLQRLTSQVQALQSSLGQLQEQLEHGELPATEQVLVQLNQQLLEVRSLWRQMLDLPAPR